MKFVKKTMVLITLIGFTLGAQPGIAKKKYKSKKGGVKNGASISGTVNFSGKRPAVRMLKVNKDNSVCGTDRPSEELIISKKGGIQNAVVYITGIERGKKWGKLSKKFVYDQKKCRFVPHIMIVKAKKSGKVLNSDSVGHNFHTISSGIYNINKKIKPNSKMKVGKKKIKKPGKVKVKCDLHGWMNGWWFVAENPYTVLTDKNGNFSIGDIPPGKYKLNIWQEKLGQVTQDLVVKAGKNSSIKVAMKGK